MANSANISAYADDAVTRFVFRPIIRSAGLQDYREVSPTKSSNALARVRLTVADQKNSMQRRTKQTVLPIMEIPSGGTSSGYIAPAKVAHEVVVMTTVLAHPRATATDIANALMLHNSSLTTDTGVAGVADTYRNLTNQVGDVLVNGVMPA